MRGNRRMVVGKNSQTGRRPQKSHFPAFPKEMWLHRWMPRLNNKDSFYIISSRELHEFHKRNQARCVILVQTRDASTESSRNACTGSQYKCLLWNFSATHASYLFKKQIRLSIVTTQIRSENHTHSLYA